MIRSRSPRSLLAAVAMLAVVLTACGASPPPGRELAHEMVDTLEGANGEPLSDDVKQCMHDAIDDFRLTEEEAQGFENLDDVAKKADDGQEQAMTIMDRFQDELASCNPAG